MNSMFYKRNPCFKPISSQEKKKEKNERYLYKNNYT